MLPLTAEVLRHILRVLQALNPDATDPEGGVVGQKFTSPFFFSTNF